MPHSRIVMKRTGQWVLIGIVASVLCGSGCSGSEEAPGLNRWAIYSDILNRVTKDLDLETPVAIHPLLGQLDWGPGGGGARMDSFNQTDTSVIPSFVEAHSAEYCLCALTAQKSCDRSKDAVSVILSELEETGEGQVASVTLVMDNRVPPGALAYYAADIQIRRGRWRVVSFRRMH